MCQRNLDRLVERAEQRNNFLWIDMESSPYVDPTIDAVQAHASEDRADRHRAPGLPLSHGKGCRGSLIPLGSAIRIVKGAYLEPPDVAFPKKSDVDENFYKLCTRLMQPDARQAGCLLHIATHDMSLIDRLSAYIEQNKVPTSAYEFAMLYGIQRGQQQRLARQGKRAARAHQLRRVLVPLVHAPARRAPGQRLVRREDDVRVMAGIPRS